MFERRLRIFLLILVAAGLVLFGRTFALQGLGGDRWAQAEVGLLTRPAQVTETTRGRVLDARGVPLAVDAACTDACVDYRAVVDPPEAKWVSDTAAARLRARYGGDLRKLPLARRKAMKADAEQDVRDGVATMWATLAQLYRPADPATAAVAAADPRGAIEEVRREIVRQVELRRRLLQYRAYQGGQTRSTAAGRWLRWIGAAGDGGDGGPDIDSFAVTTGEQLQPHVVLRALDAEACNFLGKQLESFPGLTLRPSTHRFYPLHEVACHLLGRVGAPSAEELGRAKTEDETRRYEVSDDVGRDGVEELCEPLLRGVRGRVRRRAGDDAVVDQQDFVPGQDVRLTVDADLQGRVQHLLRHVVIRDGHGDLVTPAEGVSMHAAVVVLDARTNAVLALASNPTFDANDLEARYAALAADTLEEPLRDRATSDAMEPGSTAKLMVGIGAITQGVLGAHEGIECTGYLRLPAMGPDGRPVLGSDGKPTGRMVPMPHGRCWVASEYELPKLYEMSLTRPDIWAQPITSFAHHPIPLPHRGRFGNPDGFLCYADAIERSCNVFFETTADRLGPAGMDRWLESFGFGRPTGVGIYEVPGQRPGQVRSHSADPRMVNCYAGIGEVDVHATPLQVANEAATLARGGVWMRPRLLSAEAQAALDAARPPAANRPPDAVDLHLDPEGLRQCRDGMVAVVDDVPVGTGHIDHPKWLTVAAKTGTAEVSRLTVVVTDAQGRRSRQLLAPVVRGGPETATPWYRTNNAEGKTVTQDWYMGYAPAQDPKVAFAVLVEWAGSSGGLAAGPVATGLLDACVADGYLRPPAAGPATEPTTQP